MQLLVDYSSLLYRAYHASPSSIPMNGVHGLLGMLARVIGSRRPQCLAMAADDDWRPQFRVEALPMYKAQRVSEEVDPVTEQELVGRHVLQALGLAVVGHAGYEAEDVIAWIEDKYGIPGRRYGDFALLRGDPSDGLPGVPGIGEKTAASLIAQYGSLEGLLAAPKLPVKLRAKLDEHQAYLEAARRVVLPVRNLPLPEVPLELPRRVAEPRKLEALERQYSLSNAVARLRDVLGF
jgi:5'-3' exonuclease